MRPDSGAGPVLGLDHVTLVVAALDDAVAAYAALFGQPCARRGRDAGVDWALFALANTALVLVAPCGTPDGPAAHVAGAPARSIAALAFATADPAGAARLLDR
ncbi:MAG: hypothetical protein K2X49_22255, partial [Acetobacteraceae bacterium]|nr:hypothetical protein [Acetobacteraceae bacterium]